MDLMEARRQSHAARKSVLHDVNITDKGVSLSEAMDFRIPQDDPMAHLAGGMPMPEAVDPSSLPSDIGNFAKSTARAVAGGVQDMVKGVVSASDDIGQFIDSKLGGLGYINYDENGLSFSREKPQDMPDMDDAFSQGLRNAGIEVPQGDGVVENLGRGLVQFAAGMGVAPIRGVSLLANMGRGAFADALFDPEGGNLSTLLVELGISNDVISLLDSKVGEDAEAAERLKGRLKAAVEGTIGGGIIDTIVAGFRAARSDEGLTATIKGKLQAAGERLNQPGPAPDTLGSNLGNVFEPILKADADNPPPNLTASPLTLSEMPHPLTDRAREIADERIARQRAEQEAIAAEGGKPKRITDKVKVEDLAATFDEDHLARHGRKLDPTNEADQDIAASELAAQIDVQLTQADTGAGWYDADVQKTFEMMSTIPGLERIQNDETARVIWSALAAPTSIGQKVIHNTKAAIGALRGYFRTGNISIDPPAKGAITEGIEGAGWGAKAPSVIAGMKVIRYLIDEYGEEGFVDWWLSPHTKGELTAVRKAAGLSGPPSGLSGTADSMHFGAMVLGDKTGRFSLNINGYEGTTKDVWYSRSYNRVFGQMFGPDAPKTGEKVVQGGPRNQEERRQMEAFNQKVIAKVAADNNLSEADAQAILWFYEQGLYTSLGVTSRPGAFSQGVGEVHESLGVRQTIRGSDGTQVETVPREETEGLRGITAQERTVRNQRRDGLRQVSDNSGNTARPSGPYQRNSGTDDGRTGLLEFIPNPVSHAKYTAFGLKVPKIKQVDAASSAQAYHDDMVEAMANHKFAAAVEIKSPEDLANMRTFRTEGGSGFAIKDDGDIVAVFGVSSEKGSSYSMLQAAVSAGGKKLDAFNTVLPRIYMTAGFKPVARLAWNDEFAPPNWDKATFGEFNNGEPDIVFFVHDPNYFKPANFDMNTVPLADDYDSAVALQDAALGDN